MFRRSRHDYNPSAIEQAGQRNWNEAYSYHRDNARRWFFVAAGMVLITGIAEVRGWMHDGQPKRIPFVVDRDGPSVRTAMLIENMPDAARIRGHLTTWVSGFRSVVSDPIYQKRLIDQTYAWTDATAIGREQLDKWYVVNNPYDRVKKTTVDVDITSVVPQGGDVWLVDWTETAWAREPGKLVQTSHWRMTVTVHIKLPETDNEVIANWDGVFTQSFHLLSLDTGA